MPDPDLSTVPATVVEALARLNRIDEFGYTFLDGAGKPTKFPFSALWKAAEDRARILLGTGLRKGDRVAMVLSQPEDFVITFLACLVSGLVPVPMYPPLSFGKLDAWADGAVNILNAAGAQLLLTDKQIASVLWQVMPKVKSLKDLHTIEKLDTLPSAPGPLPTVTPDGIAFLQFTSGSTSAPKGVMVSHRNLVANTWAIATEGMRISPGDRAVSWLPLYHDMGLIGLVITPIMRGVETIYIPTLSFVKRPNIWMQTMHEYKAHYSFGPNFAYALAARRATETDLKTWDLSNVRCLGCGAEPIHAAVMQEFIQRFQPCGLKPGVIMPAYGMAEATLAMTFHDLGTAFDTLSLDAEAFRASGDVAAPKDDEVALSFVSVGKPFSGHELRILDTEGNVLAEDREGEIVFRGPSVTSGYWQNEDATAAAYRNGWLHSGDLGFLRDGNLYITGRCKDLIILNGRNHHPQTIEWAVQDLEGVRKGNVVAFSRPGAETEELIVVCETKSGHPADLAETVKKAVVDALSLKVSDVILLGAGQLPKTSSGKLQRRKTREQYLSGELGQEGVRTLGSTGETLNVAKHMARSLLGRATHMASKVLARPE